MKSTRPNSPSRDQSGVALVIVLGLLVLITGIAVAFLSSITTDAQTTSHYVKNVQGQQLVQSVVSIAMSQLKDATTQGPNVTWVSQPGMIRTFDSNGSPKHSYRLYSSSTMKLGGSVDPESEVGVIQRKEWASYPAHMVDLNKPARNSAGEFVYPILDPRASELAEKIEGYEFDVADMGGKFVTESSPAPMPVRWLYVLAKGDIVTGKELDRTTATFDTASKDNPIVGRIAFWTDDESCKVNINTAAGHEWNPPTTSYGAPSGSYWDVPRTFSLFDRQALANFQPVQGEYQRYPGHPATTYLSAVFPTLTSEQIGKIASRVQTGGSKGGTAVANGRLIGDADRLYASIDELIFDPERQNQPITRERLERGRFFLTAHSRAPEANLFNMPRIAIWPIHRTDSNATRSAYDRLIAFCSTINGQPYFFDRLNADSTTADYTGRNVALYQYLQRLTDKAIPGYGGKFTTKYGAADRDQILTEIVDYIRSTNLFDDTIEPTPYSYPTKGAQFTNRRTSATGVDSGHGQVTPLRIGTTQGFGRFYTISEMGMHFICTADPTTPESNLITGPTANRTLQTVLGPNQRRIEAMLLLEFFSPAQGWTGIVPDMQVRIRGLNSMTVNGTSLGFPSDATMRVTASGTSTYHGRAWGGPSGFRFQLNGRRLPARGFMPADSGLSDSNRYPFISIPITINVPATGSPTMSFAAGELTVDIHTGATATPSAANLVQTLKVQFPNGTFPIPNLVKTGTPAQQVTAPSTPASSATTAQNWWSFSSVGAINGQTGRLAHVNRAPGSNGKPEEGAFLRAEDVVRTVQPSHGDMRLVAGRQNVAKAVFVKHPAYDNTNTRLAHTLMEPVGMTYTQSPDMGGKLVTGANYDGGHVPDLPSTIDANSRTRLDRGDWDTGVAGVTDGAYINKPDEGNNYRGTGAQIPYFDNNQAQEAGGPTFFSPNRQMPSAVMFGSLPTGMFADAGAGRSWRTLLFRPDTAAPTAGTHDGAKSPKDHLLLDLFWMPVVEPYAISEPFSTAGKINLNHQVAPFTYIKRTTALRALLKSERVTAIPVADANKYKGGSAGTYRFEIDADETLKAFDQRFAQGVNKPFRSASEICEMYLVPKGQTLSGMPTYWNSTNRLTGDNLRERPYAALYPRLTTKSNVYSVHFCVQTLQQVNRNLSGSWKTWNETKDRVTSEFRGTTIIERYVDLQDDLPDFAQSSLDPEETLDRHAKLRVLMNRKFSP